MHLISIFSQEGHAMISEQLLTITPVDHMLGTKEHKKNL